MVTMTPATSFARTVLRLEDETRHDPIDLRQPLRAVLSNRPRAALRDAERELLAGLA